MPPGFGGKGVNTGDQRSVQEVGSELLCLGSATSHPGSIFIHIQRDVTVPQHRPLCARWVHPGGGLAPGVVTHVSHLTLAHGHTSKPGNDRIFAFQGLRATLASPAVCVVDLSPSDLGVGTGEPWSKWLRWSPGPEVLRLRFASCSVLNALGALGKVTFLSSGSSSEQGEVWTSLVSEAFT